MIFQQLQPGHAAFLCGAAYVGYNSEFSSMIRNTSGTAIRTMMRGGTKILLLGSAAVVVRYTMSVYFGDLRAWRCLRAYLSDALMRSAENPDLPPEVQRTQFTGTEMPNRTPTVGHTHGQSASARSNASLFCARVAEALGRIPYYVQCSRSDQRQGRQGSRAHYWAKDLTVEPSRYDPPEDAVITMIDVDYYYNMSEQLAEEFKPTLLYTFQPSQVCKNGDEYSYTFTGNNEVDYTVSGGGRYCHPIWNYSVDHVVVSRKLYGIPLVTAAYLVDRRSVDDDHQVVCLTPLKRWVGFRAILSYFLSGRELERLEPVEGDFLRMRIQTESGLLVSTGMVGKYAQATVPIAVDDAIAISAATTSVKLSLPTVLTYITEGGLVDRRVEASALLMYHRGENVKPSNAFVFPVHESVRNYSFTPEEFDPSDKPSLKPFMSPFIDGAYAPTLGPANERACIDGRIVKFAAGNARVKMTTFLSTAMTEFVAHLIPEKGSLEPYSLDEVYERQSRPSQRIILEQSLAQGADRKVKMFMKREAYQDPKDPRPISTINGVDKREYSRYIYPVADLLKQQDWYAFGKTPAEIAYRVTEVLAEADNASNTDFSRFDGHVTSVLRHLERAVLVRAFHANYTYEISELHASQYHQSAFGRFGNKYETGTARASGSPETAAFNSIANAFVAYLSFRLSKENGAYVGPDEAWSRLGVYGGDDGLTANVKPVNYVKAAHMVGLKLDIELITRGEFGITFLSRMYGPHVWYGDTNSCCDLPRQLSKIHTTVVLPANVSAFDKLLEKARSYYLTDKFTPVIGEFVTKIATHQDLNIGMRASTASIRAWNSELPPDVQYPNEEADWMHDYAFNSLEGFDFQLFRDWLETTSNLDDFLTPPLCCDTKAPKVTRPTVVRDEVVEPELRSSQPPIPAPRPDLERADSRSRKTRSKGKRNSEDHGEDHRASAESAGKGKKKARGRSPRA